MTSRKNIKFFDFNGVNVAKHWHVAGEVFAISDCLVLYGIHVCVHLHYTLHFSLLLKATIATENLRSLIKIRDLKFSSKKIRDLRSDTLKNLNSKIQDPLIHPPPLMAYTYNVYM